MMIRELALEGLEQVLNRVIGLDPDAGERLAALHGQSIRIDLRGTGIQWIFVPAHDGHLRVVGSLEGKPGCTLAGSPLDLLRARAAGAQQLFAGHVQIEGDTELARRFSEVLADLDIDWEEQLSRFTGDIVAHEIGRSVRAASGEGARIRRSSEQILSEYLTEEARLLPHRFEVEDFIADVDTLRDDAERLAARIALLEKRRRGGRA
jgi:ubiquinone biosynthesis protein UbiJ